MSSGETQIVCRRCRETIPADGDNCPHCGASIRGTLGPIAAVVFGLVIAGSSVLGQLWFFAAIGLAIAAIGGYLIYDKRSRLAEAREDTRSVSDLTEDTLE